MVNHSHALTVSMREGMMNGKRSIKKSERNWPVKKSIRLVKENIAHELDKLAGRE